MKTTAPVYGLNADPEWSKRLDSATDWLALGVCLAGGLSLIPWVAGVAESEPFHTRLILTGPGGALCLILAGLSLWCLRPAARNSRIRHAAPVGAGILVAVALLITVQGATEPKPDPRGVQQAALAGYGMGEGPNTTPVTAMVLLAAGIALLLLYGVPKTSYEGGDAGEEAPRGLRPARWLASLVIMVSVVSLYVHVFGTLSRQEMALAPLLMPWMTGLVMLGLGAGILCATPHKGYVGMLISREMDGTLARRVSLVIFIPMLAALLTEAVEGAGRLSLGRGLAMNGLLNVGALTVAVYLIATSFGRANAERTWAERRMAEAELRYRTLFEQAPCGVCLFDPGTGRIVEGNQKAHEQLGYGRDEFVKLRIQDLEVCESESEVRRHIERVMDRGQEQFETRQRTKGGELRDIEVRVQTVRFDHHTYFHSLFLDITESKRARQREQLLAHALQCLSEMVMIADLEHRFVYVNQAFVETCGYSVEETMGRGPELIWSQSNPPGLLELIKAETGESGWHGQVRVRTKAGREFTAALKTSRIHDEKGALARKFH